jgi:hypothetical protein
MSDPVDDALNFLEQHAPGFLKGAVETLREGWDFVVASFPDPDVIRTQGHNLSSLHDRGQKLFEQYAQGISTLQGKWQGDLADTYLPPSGMAIAEQHGVEVTDNSVSTQLLTNFSTFVDSLDHNSGTHYNWGTKFDDVRGKQTEARVTIAGSVVLAAGALAVPGAGELFDGGEIPGAAAIIAGILNGVRQIWQDYKIIIIVTGAVAGAAVITAIAVDELAKPAIVQTTATGGYPADWTLPDGSELADGLKKIAEQLWDKFKDMLKALGLTDDQIAKLIAYVAATYCSATAAESLLSSLIDSISGSDPNTQNKIINSIINFTKGVKAASTEVKRLLYVMMNLLVQGYKPVGLGLPYADGSGVLRDVDVTAKPISGSGPTLYIEVGGSNKGDTKVDIANPLDVSEFDKFQAQINQLKIYADSQTPPGTAQCYLEEPAFPQPADPIPTNNPWARFLRAKAYAESVLGPGNVFVIPAGDNNKGSCIP